MNPQFFSNPSGYKVFAKDRIILDREYFAPAASRSDVEIRWHHPEWVLAEDRKLIEEGLLHMINRGHPIVEKSKAWLSYRWLEVDDNVVGAEANTVAGDLIVRAVRKGQSRWRP